MGILVMLFTEKPKLCSHTSNCQGCLSFVDSSVNTVPLSELDQNIGHNKGQRAIWAGQPPRASIGLTWRPRVRAPANALFFSFVDVKKWGRNEYQASRASRLLVRGCFGRSWQRGRRENCATGLANSKFDKEQGGRWLEFLLEWHNCHTSQLVCEITVTIQLMTCSCLSFVMLQQLFQISN